MPQTIVYLDNNATTFTNETTRLEINKWFNTGNPSAEYAAESRKLMSKFRNYLSSLLNLQDYHIIFNSGATEGNVTVIRTVCEAYIAKYHEIPHIICGALEHSSILTTLTHLAALGNCTVSVIPQFKGYIHPTAVERQIRHNTLMVCVMHANNETGALNDIDSIAKICGKKNVWFHTDAVQTMNKIPPRGMPGLDSFTCSFHKCYGPPGCGAVIMRKDSVRNLGVKALIPGSQNDGFRGGTENIPAIAGCFIAYKTCMMGRERKNAALGALRIYLLQLLQNSYILLPYDDYLNGKFVTDPVRATCIIITPPQAHLNNTLLVCVGHIPGVDKVCNTQLKRDLQAMGCLVSIGSACNTQSDKASHVLNAMGADERIRRGTLRISWCDYTKKEEINYFAKCLHRLIYGRKA